MNITQPTPTEIGQRKFIKIESKSYKNQRFEFQSYELAFAVRQTVYLKIIEFDTNNDQQFQQSQIREFLERVLHQSQTEIKYVVRNVFRYDYNNDGVIEYDELVNFCMEQHFGELAIQRLHKKKIYKKGSQRLMDEREFYQTIQYALSFVQFITAESDVRIAFETIDSDKDGEISYEDYFRFLKEYFGTKSYAASLVNKHSILEEIHASREKKGELNIVKRYSKYEKLPTNNLPNNYQPNNKITPPIASLKPTAQQSNVSSNSNNMATSNANNKKGSKIEITLSHKNKQTKTQIILSAAEQVISNQIARLVYTQLVVMLTAFDNDRDCMLSPEDVISFMRTHFNYGESSLSEVYRKHNLSKNKLMGYNEAAKIVMSEQINRSFKTYEHENANKNINLDQFCQTMEKICSIVKNTPIVSKYEQLFNMRMEKGVSYGEAENLVSVVFGSYLKK